MDMSPAKTTERPSLAKAAARGAAWITVARAFNYGSALFINPAPAHDGFFSGSVLFAYKINWQSVMFFGYGDDRTLDEQRRLQKFDRQLFVKVSYAFQR